VSCQTKRWHRCSRIRCGFNNSGGVVFKEVYEYDYVDEKPEYPGSDTALMKFINENRNYPKNAYRHGVEGRVICSFVVNADGKVSNIEVIKGVESSLNAEAVRILSLMPDWHPGKIGGKGSSCTGNSSGCRFADKNKKCCSMGTAFIFCGCDVE